MFTPISLRSSVLRAAFGGNQAKGVSRRSRLGVLRLEERDVPATILVDSASDNTNGSDSKVTLREAILSANQDSDFNPSLSGHVTGTYGVDTIVFSTSVFASQQTITIANATHLPITDALTITGPAASVVIDAKTKSRIFFIENGTSAVFDVAISDVIMTNGNVVPPADRGGAMFISNGRDTSLTRCDFSDNAAAHGGAIYAEDIELSMDSSSIAGNSASQDGGGVFLQNSIANITDVQFTGNMAGGNGGAIIASGGGSLYSEDCTFGSGSLAGNTATGNGGAIYSVVATSIITSHFTTNAATNGGAVEIATSTGSLFMNSCDLFGDVNNPPMAVEGGCIRFLHVSTTNPSIVRDTTFDEGYAQARGGGICIVGSGTVSLESKVTPTATVDSKFVMTSGGARNDINSGPNYGIGGGIYIGARDGQSPTVSMSKIRLGFEIGGIHANFANYGGNLAIEGTSGNVTIQDSVLDHGNNHIPNGLNPMPLRGGNMIIKDTTGGLISVKNSQLTGGTAAEGGGVAVINSAATVTFDTCTLDKNISSDRGGGVFVDSVIPEESTLSRAVTFTTCSIAGNTAGSGGGVYSLGTGSSKTSGALTINRSTIENNRALDDSRGGGGITNDRGASVIIKNSTINNNEAVGNGGGIFYPNGAICDATYNIRNVTVYGNKADRGGGIFVKANSAIGATSFKLYNSTIAANSASHSPTSSTEKYFGGGIAFQDFGDNDKIYLDSSIVATNTCNSLNVDRGPDIGGQGTKAVTGDFDLFPTATYGNGFDPSGLGTNVVLDSGATPIFSSAGLANNGGPTKTLALMTGSSAIDKGRNTLGLTTDQRDTGNPRVLGIFADIGAYEFPAEDEAA